MYCSLDSKLAANLLASQMRMSTSCCYNDAMKSWLHLISSYPFVLWGSDGKNRWAEVSRPPVCFYSKPAPHCTGESFSSVSRYGLSVQKGLSCHCCLWNSSNGWGIVEETVSPSSQQETSACWGVWLMTVLLSCSTEDALFGFPPRSFIYLFFLKHSFLYFASFPFCGPGVFSWNVFFSSPSVSVRQNGHLSAKWFWRSQRRK